MGERYVVTGSQGQLGRCLVRLLEGSAGRANGLVRGFARAELDIGDAEAVSRIFENLPGGPPDALVNAAAYNQVDLCESEGRSEADRVNGEGPRLLAEVCERVGTRLVHVSTDYVLSGVGPTPLVEDSEPAPSTAYGRSKLRGEEQVRKTSVEAMIVRTSWVFGPGRNFVGAMLRQARLRRTGEVEGPLRVVDDQRGCPTYAADLAEGIRDLVESTVTGSGDGGVYHLCNAPDPGDDAAPTWWDFARAILDARGFEDVPIDRATTADFAAPAPRPAFSVLACERAAEKGVRLRSWREALAAYLDSPDLELTRQLTDPTSSGPGATTG
jgi:dTDP-4-dehydrorhamnose reductase